MPNQARPVADDSHPDGQAVRLLGRLLGHPHPE